MNEKDVEQLSIWVRDILREYDPSVVPWDQCDEGIKNRYRHLSRALLNKAPPCLSALPIVVDAGPAKD